MFFNNEEKKQNDKQETQTEETDLTRKWGWDRRETTTDNKNQMYSVYRNITMYWSCFYENI